MAVTAVYGIDGEDFGILCVAFPGYRILRCKEFPPFISEEKIIVFSDDDPFTRYPEKEVIQIRGGASVRLNTREGFIYFLVQKKGVPISDAQFELLMMMEESDFWTAAKAGLVLGSFADVLEKHPVRQRASVYRLYEVLFEDFGAAYVEYWRLKETMSVMQLFSSLLSMAQTAREAHRRGDLKPRYRDILLKNRRYEPIFKEAMLEFLESKRDETCFLSFVADCTDPPKPWKRMLVSGDWSDLDVMT